MLLYASCWGSATREVCCLHLLLMRFSGTCEKGASPKEHPSPCTQTVQQPLLVLSGL